ncbi:MAG: TMEM175 family protein [Bacteroidota bacterium]
MLPWKRTRPVSRLEGFSDAVFAFSATLLVVSLEVPQTFPELVADLRGFGAFGVSFLALVLIWSVHNAFFRRYGLDDGLTVVLNTALLFVVLFYVYPLKFMAEMQAALVMGTGGAQFGLQSEGDLQLLFVLYSAGFVAIFACVMLLYGHAYRRRDALGLSAYERHEAAVLARHYGLFVLVGLLSIALAVLGWGLTIGAPGFIYALLGPLCGVHGWWSGERAPDRDLVPGAEAKNDQGLEGEHEESPLIA